MYTYTKHTIDSDYKPRLQIVCMLILKTFFKCYLSLFRFLWFFVLTCLQRWFHLLTTTIIFNTEVATESCFIFCFNKMHPRRCPSDQNYFMKKSQQFVSETVVIPCQCACDDEKKPPQLCLTVIWLKIKSGTSL